MSNRIGFAVYLSTFKRQLPFLQKLKNKEVSIFTSLHITEEMTDSYVQDIEEMCEWLHKNDFKILADVSPITLEIFQESNIHSLAKRFHLSNLRLDFGFDLEKLDELEQLDNLDLTFNASTIGEQDRVREGAFYMHNFYPRPETGLDKEFFVQLNKKIWKNKGKVLAFISGDVEKRGPIHAGLPTLEYHRDLSPYAQYVDLAKQYQVDEIYVGDSMLSEKELALILSYIEEGQVRIPIDFSEEHQHLYQQPFTIRVDSPNTLMRLQESRQYAQQGKSIEPVNQWERVRGTVTMDNKYYKRYSGEIQIMKTDFPADDKVNVIGKIDQKYLLLLDNIDNGEKILFVPKD